MNFLVPMSVAQMTSLVGLAGAILAGYGYFPQVEHLVRERCAAGISRKAFMIWLVAAVLMTIHAIAIGDPVFITLGAIQIAATSMVVWCATAYKGQYCPTHLPQAGTGNANK